MVFSVIFVLTFVSTIIVSFSSAFVTVVFVLSAYFPSGVTDIAISTFVLDLAWSSFVVSIFIRDLCVSYTFL